MIPGEMILSKNDVEINKGNKSISVKVTNKGDRPSQVGSHHHFFEVNSALSFDREKAFGKRLDVPSGSSVRFEPGETKTVELVDYKGLREVYGFDEYVEGALDSEYGENRKHSYKYDKDGEVWAFKGSLQNNPSQLPDYNKVSVRLMDWSKKVIANNKK